ncbi:MAG: hypothetical protein KGL39_54295, partial [Patescibacteria group bacterium]|nr:hypothetical protein [Patescibacteria group bacterium]
MQTSTKIILRRAPRGGLSSADRSYRGGQFIAAAVWNAEKAKALADLPGLITSFGDDIQFLRRVYEQQVGLLKLPAGALGKVEIIPPSTVAARMKARIRETYTRAFALGKRHAGNLTSVNSDDAIAIKGVRLDEFAYLRSFLDDMANGNG